MIPIIASNINGLLNRPQMGLKQLQRSRSYLSQNAFLFPLNVSRLAFRHEIQRTFLWLVNNPSDCYLFAISYRNGYNLGQPEYSKIFNRLSVFS